MSLATRLAFVFMIVLLVGCQAAQVAPLKHSSAANDIQDVINAWNLHCDQSSFLPCPPDAGESSCTATMASQFYGAAFSADCQSLMEAMAAELDSLPLPSPNLDDSLNAVLEDDNWFN